VVGKCVFGGSYSVEMLFVGCSGALCDSKWSVGCHKYLLDGFYSVAMLLDGCSRVLVTLV